MITQAIIIQFKDEQWRISTKKNDLEKIYQDFYNDLYNHNQSIKNALMKGIEGLLTTFMDAIHKAVDQKITERELRSATNVMAKKKALSMMKSL